MQQQTPCDVIGHLLWGRKWRPYKGAINIASGIKTANPRKLKGKATAKMATATGTDPRKANRPLWTHDTRRPGRRFRHSSIIIYRSWSNWPGECSARHDGKLVCLNGRGRIPQASRLLTEAKMPCYCVSIKKWLLLFTVDSFSTSEFIFMKKRFRACIDKVGLSGPNYTYSEHTHHTL